MKWTILILLVILTATSAKFYSTNPYKNRITYPHLHIGQNYTTTSNFFEEKLRPESNTVRWTEYGSYRIKLDKIHLMRESYTLLIRTKYGPNIRIIPFETTKIYLPPNYYGIRYDKQLQTVYLKKYSD